MTMEEALKILEMQEEILQFSHFTNSDAWELGCMMVLESKRRGLPIAITIQLNNGYTVFQYGNDGTNLDNQYWLTRKCNTVKRTDMSSLRHYMLLEESGDTLEDRCMKPEEYANSGGAFPVRIEEVGVIGAIAVSGMDHVADHDFLVKCVSKYLHVDEIPRISVNMI
ncbi:MAG: heme-binding protein [Lachnospiraceae bacterium]|nr:heme-binding protein [Lachnospiraceae bacterium]MDD3615706.1 heme-binding protein [Lachnospiraceae bacterium]